MFTKMKSALFGGAENSEAQASSSPLKAQTIDGGSEPTINEEDILNAFMPEEMQEEMFCFTMGDCELYKIVPRHGR